MMVLQRIIPPLSSAFERKTLETPIRFASSTQRTEIRVVFASTVVAPKKAMTRPSFVWPLFAIASRTKASYICIALDAFKIRLHCNRRRKVRLGWEIHAAQCADDAGGNGDPV